jgi:hypothetical protein
MKHIPLTQGKVALVNDADYKWLNKHKWYALQDKYTFYARRSIFLRKGEERTQAMHRLILGLQPHDKLQCDHIDGNGLNNQRSNLRLCTSTGNNRSQRKRKAHSSKYKGVCWHRRSHKWISRIRAGKTRIHLGCFDSEIEGAKAYDDAALKYHGRFALTNKMLGLRKDRRHR